MHAPRVLLGFTFFCAAIGPACSLRAESKFAMNPVAVASTATPEYTQRKFGSGPPRPESYLFTEGTFYGGATRDRNMEKMPFDQIVKPLAENLARQNYFPSKDIKDADLLIFVHWGVTTTYENPHLEEDQAEVTKWMEIAKASQQTSALFTKEDRQDMIQMIYNKYGEFPSGNAQGQLSAALAVLDADREQMLRQIGVNSKLLGFDDEVIKVRKAGKDERNLLIDLSEERYFVILMAYDYRTMKKGTTPKLLWTTRFSMRGPGTSFTTALPAMSKVAADSFGREISGLKIENPTLREGKVEVGAPTVVKEGK